VNRDRYARLKQLFIEVIELEDTDREGFLADLEARDVQAAHDLRHLIREDAPDSEAADGGSSLPEQIDGYRILGVLGVGGMGIVYLAQQQQPQREVALKLLPASVLSIRTMRRFRREVEVLGRLHHPGIAEIYDAGTWDRGEGGQPYFVMERVAGLPLNAYVRQHNLGTREVLRLLIAISEAVQHAHENGVVHRDLKPGNILVGETGAPKILDFGVARVTDADVQVTTLRTEIGQLVGTLPYMSPEQIDGDPAAIDARSDVYALGVLMYELLAGVLPFDGRTASVPDLVRAIRDDDPRPLSTVDRSYRGDLDTIVATAMAKEPGHRYESAEAFRSDLLRHLESQPIAARQPSTWYQVAKFSRRHQGLVAGLALAFIMLIAGTIVSTVFAIRAGERSRLLAIEAGRLEAANAFFTEMLDATNPEINRLDLERPRDVKVADVLDYAARHIGSTYADQPEVEVSTRSILASAYFSLELTSKAQEQVEEALRLARVNFGEEHPETLRLIIRRAGMPATAEELEEHVRTLENVLPRCESLFGPDHADTIGCLNTLASRLYSAGRRTEARECASEALQRARRGLPRDHEELVVAMNNLAHFEIALGNAERAAALFREAWEARRESFGDDHPATIRSRSNMVRGLLAGGRRDEAIAVQREVVEAQRCIFGEESGPVLFSMNNLAVLLGAGGDVLGARQIMEQLVEINTRKYGPEDSRTLLVKFNLAHNYKRTKEYERAVTLAGEVLEARLRIFDDDSTEVANSRRLLGEICLDQGRPAEAVPLLSAALKSLVQINGAADTMVINGVRNTLARGLIALERFEEAEALLRESHDAAVRKHGPAHGAVRQRAGDLAALYDAWGREELAAEWRARSAPAGPGETAVADRRAPGNP